MTDGSSMDGRLSAKALLAIYEISREMSPILLKATREIENFKLNFNEVPLQLQGIARLVGEASDALFAMEDQALHRVKDFSERVGDHMQSQIESECKKDLRIESLSAEVRRLNERLRASRHQEHDYRKPEIRAMVLGLTGGKCVYCDCEISNEKDDGKETFAVDHIVSKADGGPDHIKNYVPSCHRCNTSKSTSHVVSFIRRRASA